LNVERNGAKLAGQFMGDDVVAGYAATVKVLEKFRLAGLQAACFAINPVDISNLERRGCTVRGTRRKAFNDLP